jgi:hypothetical protein
MVTSGLSLVGKVCPMPILQKSRGLLVTCCYLVGSTYVTHILLGVGQKQIDKKNIYMFKFFKFIIFKNPNNKSKSL